ncbi:LysR family transcriptional regulator [Bariatricus sp. SGI.154]|uniref:LysR family transcriptional regulator n=1 Tax=Bariatricus sp. SGI.154 TaxID=3420549 RepID=UPI003D057691
MNINYEYYRIFYYVAKYKNLTRAAEVLCNNQPNITRTIKLMEHEFGCNLIVRSNRGISLTPEGEQLYSHLKIAVHQIQLAENEILKTSELQNGVVTIGASETGLRMLLLPVLSHFKKAYPGIRVRIINHLTTQALISARDGVVDFSVVAAPADIAKPLLSESLLTFTDIPIAGASFSHLKNTPLSLIELSKYPLICLGEDTMTYRFYEKFYQRHKLLMEPEFVAATTDQILPMIKNNLGFGFIPEIYAVEALKSESVFKIPLTTPIPSREIYFIQNENHPLSAAARELKKLLLEYAQSIMR